MSMEPENQLEFCQRVFPLQGVLKTEMEILSAFKKEKKDLVLKILQTLFNDLETAKAFSDQGDITQARRFIWFFSANDIMKKNQGMGRFARWLYLFFNKLGFFKETAALIRIKDSLIANQFDKVSVFSVKSENILTHKNQISADLFQQLDLKINAESCSINETTNVSEIFEAKLFKNFKDQKTKKSILAYLIKKLHAGPQGMLVLLSSLVSEVLLVPPRFGRKDSIGFDAKVKESRQRYEIVATDYGFTIKEVAEWDGNCFIEMTWDFDFSACPKPMSFTNESEPQPKVSLIEGKIQCPGQETFAACLGKFLGFFDIKPIQRNSEKLSDFEEKTTPSSPSKKTSAPASSQPQPQQGYTEAPTFEVWCQRGGHEQNIHLFPEYGAVCLKACGAPSTGLGALGRLSNAWRTPFPSIILKNKELRLPSAEPFPFPSSQEEGQCDILEENFNNKEWIDVFNVALSAFVHVEGEVMTLEDSFQVACVYYLQLTADAVLRALPCLMSLGICQTEAFISKFSEIKPSSEVKFSEVNPSEAKQARLSWFFGHIILNREFARLDQPENQEKSMLANFLKNQSELEKQWRAVFISVYTLILDLNKKIREANKAEKKKTENTKVSEESFLRAAFRFAAQEANKLPKILQPNRLEKLLGLRRRAVIALKTLTMFDGVVLSISDKETIRRELMAIHQLIEGDKELEEMRLSAYKKSVNIGRINTLLSPDEKIATASAASAANAPTASFSTVSVPAANAPAASSSPSMRPLPPPLPPRPTGGVSP